MKPLVALSAIVLTGCPASWGFVGQVAAPRGETQVLAVTNGSEMSSDALVPVAGATITCDGCTQPIVIERDGRFRVPLGTQYDAPPPLVLHVRADGYEPVDVEVPRAPSVSQAGPASVLIVLKKTAP